MNTDAKKLGQTEQPKIITAYQCPKCGLIGTDYEQSVEHVNIPIDAEPLPHGLIYHAKTIDFVAFPPWFEVVCSTAITNEHSVRQKSVEIFNIVDNESTIYGSFKTKEHLTRFLNIPSQAGGILRKNRYWLLTEEELHEFIGKYPKFLKGIKERHGIESLIRTCPQIEAILSQ
jgi:hypothetical protein